MSLPPPRKLGTFAGYARIPPATVEQKKVLSPYPFDILGNSLPLPSAKDLYDCLPGNALHLSRKLPVTVLQNLLRYPPDLLQGRGSKVMSSFPSLPLPSLSLLLGGGG